MLCKPFHVKNLKLIFLTGSANLCFTKISCINLVLIRIQHEFFLLLFLQYYAESHAIINFSCYSIMLNLTP